MEPADEGYPEEDEIDGGDTVPPPAAKPKIGLIVGGSALGVVVFASLAFLVYQLLSPSQATITVHTEPRSSEAVITIDGAKVPQDMAVPVQPGEHDVALRMPGQPEQRSPVSVGRGQPRVVNFQIEIAKPAPEPAKAEPATPPEPAKTPEPPKPEAAVTPKTAEAAAPAPKPEPAQPTPAPEPKTFSLRVETDPPGAVVLFGKKKGDAPLELHDLDRKKSYTADARLKGYRSSPVSVKFDGTDPMVVTVKLEKEPERTEPAHEERPKASAEERPKAPREDRPKAAPKGTGSLVCSSSPVAKVFVDGKSTNRFTPIPMSNPLKLSAGKHTIKFDDGNGKSATVQVTINPDETARLLAVPLQ